MTAPSCASLSCQVPNPIAGIEVYRQTVSMPKLDRRTIASDIRPCSTFAWYFGVPFLLVVVEVVLERRIVARLVTSALLRWRRIWTFLRA